MLLPVRQSSARVLIAALGLAAVLGVGVGPRAASAQEELFVGDSVGNSITVYSRSASGNAVPIRTISGSATGLAGPQGIVVDVVNDELFVANYYNSITVYGRTGSGNVAPVRTLSGSATGLSTPFSLVVDLVHDELLVANGSGGSGSITVYRRAASGNTVPLRTLSGEATQLATPQRWPSIWSTTNWWCVTAWASR